MFLIVLVGMDQMILFVATDERGGAKMQDQGNKLGRKKYDDNFDDDDEEEDSLHQGRLR
jgi:hypothetical protein